MSESDKSASNMPTVVIVVLALLGLATLPQGGGKPPDSSPKPVASAGESGSSMRVTEDENDLGPLATLDSDRGPGKSTPGDPPCPKPEGARYVDGGQDKRDEILRANHDLRFLIVLVPDPDDSSMSHEFDLMLNAAQRAAESAGFVALRWSSMPGFPPSPGGAPLGVTKANPAHIKGDLGGRGIDLEIKAENRPPPGPARKWPASVLCRKSSQESTGLLLLLVPESPTWGVDKGRLGEAIGLIHRQQMLHADCSKCRSPGAALDDKVRIVGPNYSGSFRSLTQVLKSSLTAPGEQRFVIYNGHATSPDLKLLQTIPAGLVKFQSTIHDDSTLAKAVQTFIDRTAFRARKSRCAMLVESNTGFGRNTRRDARSSAWETDYYSFPLNISKIRETYSAKGYLQSAEPLKLTSPERLSPLEMAGQAAGRDLIPTVTPGPSAVEGELGLAQMLLELERRRYPWVGIAATNPEDRLFLAERVRVAYPDVRLFFTDATTLYAHPSVVPYLRGSLVASTYPLDLGSQAWTASPGSVGGKVDRIAFSHYYEEGTYNATVAHLADLKLDDTPNLLDYAYPGEPSTDDPVPSIWISVVGQRGLYPVHVEKPDRKAPDPKFPLIGGLYHPRLTSKLPAQDGSGLVDPSWVAAFFAIALGTIVAALWYLWACLWPSKWWAGVCPGLRERIDHPSARKLAAVTIAAVFGQVVLLSAPAWMLLSLQGFWTGNWFPRLLLGVLATLVFLVTGLASLVALFRLVLADGAKGVGAVEAGFRGVAAALVLAFVAPPIYLTARQLWAPFVPGKRPALAAERRLSSAAEQRLYCMRATRLFNGVSPLVPMLLIGAASGTILIGDWRRIGLRVRLNASLSKGAPAAGALSKVYQTIKTLGEVVDAPPKVWPAAGVWAALLPVVGLAGLGIAAAGALPGSIEPRLVFRFIFLLYFGTTLALLVIRLVETIGICRVLDRLLRGLAESPLIRAFSRVPAQFASESFWRPASTRALAADDSDPRLDRQFEAVVIGYRSHQDAIRADIRLRLVDPAAMEALAVTYSQTRRLATQKWWTAVNALTPFLAPYWAARPAIPRPGDGDKEPPGDEPGNWPGLDNDDLRGWLLTAEDLIAMVLTRQLSWLRAAVGSMFGFLVAGLVLMTLVLTSYPFEPQGPSFTLLGALTVVTVGLFVVVAVQASRDEVLSRLFKSPIDRFTLDRQFLMTMVTFVVPLLGLLGALSYPLSDMFRSILEPFFRGG